MASFLHLTLFSILCLWGASNARYLRELNVDDATTPLSPEILEDDSHLPQTPIAEEFHVVLDDKQIKFDLKDADVEDFPEELVDTDENENQEEEITTQIVEELEMAEYLGKSEPFSLQDVEIDDPTDVQSTAGEEPNEYQEGDVGEKLRDNVEEGHQGEEDVLLEEKTEVLEKESPVDSLQYAALPHNPSSRILDSTETSDTAHFVLYQALESLKDQMNLFQRTANKFIDNLKLALK